MTQLIKSNNKQKPNAKQTQPISTFNFEAIGTHWQIDINQQITPQKQTIIINKIQKQIESFDKTYSRFRKDSKITKIATYKGTYNLPTNSEKLFTLYKKLYDLTKGTFTPLIGNTLSEAGYDAEYSLTAKTLNKLPTWKETMFYQMNKITVYKPSILDFGAAGKGYLIDIIAELLKKNNINYIAIDAGGDIFYQNPEDKALRVGLENPENTEQVIGITTIRNQSICGSAGNRRKWGPYHHIINPNTNTSPKHILAIWVIAEESILADALSTCLFLTSPETLSKDFNFEYFILYPDYSFKKSNLFQAELFIK